MGTKNKPLKFHEFSPSVLDENTGLLISPARFPYHDSDGNSLGQSDKIEAAFDTLTTNPTPEEFYEAASFLIFHARHLKADQHAELAQLIRLPYKRSAGKPENLALKRAAFDSVYLNALTKFKYESRTALINSLSTNYKVSKTIARRAVLEAEEWIASPFEAAEL
jgi:hypothetical protein